MSEESINIKKATVEAVKKTLNSKSFKVKRLLLELPNYAYYHTSIKEGKVDPNDRFVGRTAIVNKLLSFIYETSSNTGTYLVTGFRGMGKTSVVNKALACLNPRHKTMPYLSLFILVLPFILYSSRFEGVINRSKGLGVIGFSLGTIILLTLFIVYLLGQNTYSRNILNKKRNRRLKIWYCIINGTDTFFNPKLSKVKHAFPRTSRYILIYLWALCYLFLCICLSTNKGDVLIHQLFWQVIASLFIIYIFLQIYMLVVKAFKIKYFNKNEDTEDENVGTQQDAKKEDISTLFYMFMVKAFKIKRFDKKKDAKNKNTSTQQDAKKENTITQEDINTFKLNGIKVFFGSASIVVFCTINYCFVSGWPRFDNAYAQVLTLLLLFLVPILLYVSLKDNLKKYREQTIIYEKPFSRFFGFLNLQHFITVRVNLGKDNLTEKDVLKYVINELYKEYSRWYTNFKNFKRGLNTIGLLTIMYLLISMFYKGFLDPEFSKFSSRTVNIPIYFPSQALAELGSELSSEDVERLFEIPPNANGATLDAYLIKIRETITNDERKKIKTNDSTQDLTQLGLELLIEEIECLFGSHTNANKAALDPYLEEIKKIITNNRGENDKVNDSSWALIQLRLELLIEGIEYLFESRTNANGTALDPYLEEIRKIITDIREKNDGANNPLLGYDQSSFYKKGRPHAQILKDIDSLVKIQGGYNLDEIDIAQLDKYELAVLEKFNLSIIKLCNEIDYLFLKFWTMSRKVLLSNHFDENNMFPSSIVNFIFPTVPILFVYVLMLFTIILLRIIPGRFLFVRTHVHTMRELRNIKKQIDASISFEESANATALHTSLFGLKKKTSYKPLEAKDITQKLIHLLDEIDNIRFVFTKVRLIFVFDELDKINPHNTVVLSNREDEFDTENKEVRYQARRKERIANILASMKHFLNSAKAKFIFIAGREMYDAALAGISDRESSLDSIFNDNKIYINSFYTEDEDINKRDITSITEQYLCQFLIPEKYSSKFKNPTNLNLYNKFLKERCFPSNTPEEKRKREKIIITLKDYITYLTYRSNGAPRKLSNLIEQNVRPVSLKELKGDGIVIVGRNNENLYLNIGFYDQYKFSLISSLTTPVFLSIGNFLHEYSDKLLVSISYMLDHLYKFHKFGISHRSLSLTPEIVDVNKEPQFREFLDKLVHSLSKSHLRPIVSGIYDYKFHSKIASEIKFLSKIDNLEGAALNFTLDESIELKRYFNKRLEQFKGGENNVVIRAKDDLDDHINNLGLLHVLIGDLHFYDEEYQDAISHYLDAIQNLRQRDIRKMVLYDFVLFVRNKLKLALAFEKNKMYDNALMTYSELTDLIIRKRNIPLRKFGLCRFIITRNDINPYTLELIQNKHVKISNISALNKAISDYEWEKKDDYYGKDNYKEMVVLGRLKSNLMKEVESPSAEAHEYDWKKLYPIQDMENFYGVDSNELIDEIEAIDTNYKPLKHNFLQTTGENMRILYQPLIAKLHLIEKSSPDKLKDVDVTRAIREFDFIRLPLRNKEKRITLSEFYNKLGDILYFKNGTLNKLLKKQILESFEKEENKQIRDAYKNLLISPIDATVFYVQSLSNLLIPVHNIYYSDEKENQENVIDMLEYYEASDLNMVLLESFFVRVGKNLKKIFKKLKTIVDKDNFKERYTYEYLTSVANGTIDLAETLTSFVKESYAFEYLSECRFIHESLDVELKDIYKLYYQAYSIYFGIGAYRLAKSQLLKILHVFREVSNESMVTSCTLELDERVIFEETKIKDIIKEAIKCVYYAYDQSHLIEGEKIDEIFEDENQKEFKSMSKSTIASEVNEIVLLKWRLELCWLKNLHDIKNNQRIDDFFIKVSKNINPYSSVRRKLNRLLKLRVKLYINKLVYNKYINQGESQISETIMEYFPYIKDVSTLKIYLILDSIGANNELLKTHYLFDVNYVATNHNQLAKAHYSMYFWCNEYQKGGFSDVEGIKKTLQDVVLNSRTLMNLKPTYHLNQALEYNYKSKNFHSRGEPLSDFLKNTSYLDDFHNDSIIHFSISIERNAVQERSKGVDQKIEKIKEIIKSNNNEAIYDYNNYFSLE